MIELRFTKNLLVSNLKSVGDAGEIMMPVLRAGLHLMLPARAGFELCYRISIPSIRG